MNNLKQSLRKVFFTALLWPSSTWAQLECSGNRCADIIGLTDSELTIQEQDLGAGVVYAEQEYCVVSYTRPSENSNENAWTREPFDVELAGDSSNGVFYLTNGGNFLPVNFLWKGGAPVSGFPVWETPAPGGLTSTQQGATSCDDDPNSQAFLRFEVSDSDLSSAQAGTYSGSFNVDLGLGSDTLYHSNVDFTVNLPTLVKISGLDDMMLTERRGGNRYRQDEEFCVYVTGGGAFQIAASGGVGITDPFLLTSGGNNIQYLVRIPVDGSPNIKMSPGTSVSAPTSGSTSLDCNGGTNSRVRIIVRDNWISGKPAGVYSGTLYLTVEPG